MRRSLFLCLCFFGSLQAFDVSDFPQEYWIKQHINAWGSKFSIETKKERIGVIIRRISISPAYEFYDRQNHFLGKAVADFQGGKISYQVMDENDSLIGFIEENLEVKTKYFTFVLDIFSSEHELLATSFENKTGVNFNLKEPLNHKEFARMERAVLHYKDDWKVKVKNPKIFEAQQLDPRLLLFWAALRADMDYEAEPY